MDGSDNVFPKIGPIRYYYYVSDIVGLRKINISTYTDKLLLATRVCILRQSYASGNTNNSGGSIDFLLSNASCNGYILNSNVQLYSVDDSSANCNLRSQGSCIWVHML